MTLGKRLLDLVLAGLLLPLILPLILLIAAVVLLREGRPVFYLSERMKTPREGFTLLKFRTMQDVPQRRGVTGSDKSAVITGTGRVLRKYRLDELPQLWNVLRGDLSFVGPRPPLREYVELAPALYREVLICRPGITGLATLYFHAHESRILATCRSPEETHAAYLRRCVPRKARLDLMYRDHRSICFDVLIVLQTFWAVVCR